MGWRGRTGAEGAMSFLIALESRSLWRGCGGIVDIENVEDLKRYKQKIEINWEGIE